MNGGALNAYTLNGSVIDPVVRTRVESAAYALADSKPRVLAYAVVDAIARAAVPGAIAKVRYRSSVSAQAKAEASGPLHRVYARLVTALQGVADIEATLGAVRGVVSPVVTALVAVAPKVLRRTFVASTASASASVVGRSGIRALVSGFGRVLGSATGAVFERDNWRDPVFPRGVASVSVAFSVVARGVVNSTARVAAVVRSSVRNAAVIVGRIPATGAADIGTVGRIGVRAPVPAVPSADLTVDSLRLVRSPVSATALADGLIDFNVIKRIPWDENAPEERTFKVNPETFVFTVVA